MVWMRHGHQPLEEDVHHPPGAMNVVPKAVGRGDGPQVRTVPDRVGACPFGPVLEAGDKGAWAGKVGMGTNFVPHSAEGPSHIQQRCPQGSCRICRPKNTRVPHTICFDENPLVPPSRKLAASMAFPSPVSKGRTGRCWPGWRQMRLSTRSWTAWFRAPLMSAARRLSASSPPSMIHHVDQLDGFPEAPSGRLCTFLVIQPTPMPIQNTTCTRTPFGPQQTRHNGLPSRPCHVQTSHWPPPWQGIGCCCLPQRRGVSAEEDRDAGEVRVQIFLRTSHCNMQGWGRVVWEQGRWGGVSMARLGLGDVDAGIHDVQ